MVLLATDVAGCPVDVSDVSIVVVGFAVMGLLLWLWVDGE